MTLLAGPAWLVDASTIRPSPTSPVSTAAPTAVASDAPRALVRFAPAASAEDRAAALARVGAVLDIELPLLGVTRVALPIDAGDGTEDARGFAVLRLARDPAIASVQLDARASVEFTPNDSLFLTDPSSGLGQWGLRAARVDKAWDIVRGSPLVTVAVIDTGVDADHPDLAGVTLPGATFVSSPDPSCQRGSQVDDNGHGTHVSGIIAANGNNGVGVAGAAFGVRVLPVKALDCTGAGLLSDVAQGVTWATDHGARVINISLGSDTDLGVLHDAIRYAAAHNVLVVAAAGNCGAASIRCPTANAPQFPGAYRETLAVAATDTADQHPRFSSVASYVGISAPGVTIWSTTPTYPTTLSRANPGTQSYAAFSGTSQSAPLVAAIAALVLSREPGLTAVQLADRLKTTADDLGVPGPDAVFGAGRLNALRAVTGTASPTYGASYDISGLPAGASAATPITGTVTLTNRSDFVWNATGSDPVRLGYHWSDLAGTTIVWEGSRSALPADVQPGGVVAVQATIAPPAILGAYVLRVDLVREGLTWFSSANVPPATHTFYVGGGYSARYDPTPASITAFLRGARTLDVAVTNLGPASWRAAGPTPVRLSYHLLRPDGSISVWDGTRASLPTDVEPGGSATVSITINVPPAGSGYVVWLDLVQEQVVWFSTQAVAGGRSLIVVPGALPPR